MPLKKILISLIIFILGIFIGFGVGAQYGKNVSAGEMARLNRAIGIMFPPPPAEIFSIYGAITKIGDSTLSLEITSPSQRILPGDTPQKEMRAVGITKDTKITEFDTFAMFQSVDPATNTIPPLPQPKVISKSQLKVGDNVSVSASENIKTEKSFTASEISRQVPPPFLPVVATPETPNFE